MLVAIVGGSGSGKSWLADRLQRVFGADAARLSLDSFYLDRSHLAPTRRGRINFDHPRAIDWARFESVLRQARGKQVVNVPQYNFGTHTRLPQDQSWVPAPLIVVDGLWLLARARVRRLFNLRIYLDCPGQLRLERRLARDVTERGRTATSVREQFWKTVAPMHERHVASQLPLADLVLQQPSSDAEIHELVATLRRLARARRHSEPSAAADGAHSVHGHGQSEHGCSCHSMPPAAHRPVSLPVTHAMREARLASASMVAHSLLL